jgi:hypothetical protein
LFVSEGFAQQTFTIYVWRFPFDFSHVTSCFSICTEAEPYSLQEKEIAIPSIDIPEARNAKLRQPFSLFLCVIIYSLVPV